MAPKVDELNTFLKMAGFASEENDLTQIITEINHNNFIFGLN